MEGKRKTEAKIRVVWLEAQEDLGPSEVGDRRKNSLLQPLEGEQPTTP
jgi:hypothetical protein